MHRIKLEYLQVTSGVGGSPLPLSGSILPANGFDAAAVGNGPVDAAINAIKRIINRKMTLQDILIQNITKGSGDLGKVHAGGKRWRDLSGFLGQHRHCGSFGRGLH